MREKNYWLKLNKSKEWWASMDSFERNAICMKYGKPSLDLLTNELEVLNMWILEQEQIRV